LIYLFFSDNVEKVEKDKKAKEEKERLRKELQSQKDSQKERERAEKEKADKERGDAKAKAKAAPSNNNSALNTNERAATQPALSYYEANVDDFGHSAPHAPNDSGMRLRPWNDCSLLELYFGPNHALYATFPVFPDYSQLFANVLQGQQSHAAPVQAVQAVQPVVVPVPVQVAQPAHANGPVTLTAHDSSDSDRYASNSFLDPLLMPSDSDDSDFDLEAHRAALEEQKRKLAKEREEIQNQMNSLKLGTLYYQF
jgi:hypothetical protein